jgi:hypothetical protein
MLELENRYYQMILEGRKEIEKEQRLREIIREELKKQ